MNDSVIRQLLATTSTEELYQVTLTLGTAANLVADVDSDWFPLIDDWLIDNKHWLSSNIVLNDLDNQSHHNIDIIICNMIRWNIIVEDNAFLHYQYLRRK